MMRRRMVRRPVLRTAAVGGAAYVAGRHMAEKDYEQQQRDATQDEQLAALQQQQYPPAPQYAAPPQYAPAPPYAASPQYPPAPPQYAGASPAGTPAQDPVAMLKQLGELKAAGVLTEEEFQAKKAQLLNQI